MPETSCARPIVRRAIEEHRVVLAGLVRLVQNVRVTVAIGIHKAQSPASATSGRQNDVVWPTPSLISCSSVAFVLVLRSRTSSSPSPSRSAVPMIANPDGGL